MLVPKVNIKRRKSNLWKLYNLVFKDAPLDSVIIPFSRTIWTPARVHELSGDLILHEMIHLEQQNYTILGAIKWWFKYRKDTQFRLSQEVVAYGEQFKYLVKAHKKLIKDRNKMAKIREIILDEFSDIMSRPMYDNMCSKGEAKKLLRDYVK
jgi:hypothetical protein